MKCNVVLGLCCTESSISYGFLERRCVELGLRHSPKRNTNTARSLPKKSLDLLGEYYRREWEMLETDLGNTET